MSKVVDGSHKLGVAMATVRGKAAVKVAVGLTAESPYKLGVAMATV